MAVAAVPAAAASSTAVAADPALLADQRPPYRGPKVVRGHVVVAGLWDVDRLTVESGAVLEFDPLVPTTVRSRGNVVVRGTLRMRPASAQVTHRLRFVGIDERRYH